MLKHVAEGGAWTEWIWAILVFYERDLRKIHCLMSSYLTRVLPLADLAAQEEALALLAQEEIFVAPTDTVYGIFARPDSPTAIEPIYIAKARPPEKAIPVLIGEMADLGQVARAPWSPLAEGLMEKFWPGALT